MSQKGTIGDLEKKMASGKKLSDNETKATRDYLF